MDMVVIAIHKCRSLKQPVQGLSLKLPDEAADAADSANDTGLALKFLLDIQRFLACGKVQQQEHLVQTSLGSELKEVVASTRVYSPRSNLMFRSNATLRTRALVGAQILVPTFVPWPPARV